ncbi:UNVERIFIED_CONTAM: hypothetical protein Sradi_5115900 [Sesamum radiatum]|uniref:Uncharacterized protein n=1 Tax=Sesamum radiatum TaxID=300843 RepID=A0AAW2M663_SESRA
MAKSKPKCYTTNKITKRKPLTQPTHTWTGKRKLPHSFFAFEEPEVRLGKRTATLESKPMDEDARKSPPSIMNCIVWNYQGLGGPWTIRHLRELVREYNPPTCVPH